MSTGYAHRGQEAEAIVKDSSDSQVPVGLLSDFTVTVSPEYQTLTGAGTNQVVDVANSVTQPEFTATYGTWSKSAWETLIDIDDVAGEIADSADVPLFSIEVTIPAADSGDDDTTFECIDCWPETELSADSESHGEMNLTFGVTTISPL